MSEVAVSPPLPHCRAGVLVLMVLLATSTAQAAVSPGRSMAALKTEVVNGLSQRERAVLSVRAYMTDLCVMDPAVFPSAGASRPTVKGRFAALTRWQWASRRGRASQHATKITFTDQGPRIDTERCWYDGKALFVLVSSGPKYWAQRKPGPFPTAVPYVLQLATGVPLMDRGRLSRLLKEEVAIKITPEVLVRGLSCYEVEHRWKGRGMTVFTVSWIAPERSWAVIRQDRTTVPDTGAGQGNMLRRVVAIEELRRVDGVWLPTHVRDDAWEVARDGRSRWMSTHIYRASDIQLNRNVEDGELAPQLPSGTVVEGKDGSKRVVGDDTSALEDALARGELPPVPPEPPRRLTPPIRRGGARK